MLRHWVIGHPSTDQEIKQVELQYPLNDHTKVVLGIGPVFFELVDDDIPTDSEHDEPSLHVYGALTLPPSDMMDRVEDPPIFIWLYVLYIKDSVIF